MTAPLNFLGTNFNEDLDTFFEELKTIDSNMAEILQKHLHHLQEFSSIDSQSSSSARQNFNAAVLIDLEILAGETP